MSYLFIQIFLLLLVAGVLGLILGWYLTRNSAAKARASLEARLQNAETDARELRAERDAEVNARHDCETGQRVLTDELNELRTRHAGPDVDVDALQAELAECRTALEAKTAPVASSEREVDSVAIASAALAAATGAQGLIEDADTAAPEPVESDDLQQIKGIGPKIASTLEDLGVKRFEQIAAWTPETVEQLNARLKFRGRIEREQWIPQARALMAARERSG